jgi:hypothetical protein
MSKQNLNPIMCKYSIAIEPLKGTKNRPWFLIALKCYLLFYWSSTTQLFASAPTSFVISSSFATTNDLLIPLEVHCFEFDMRSTSSYPPHALSRVRHSIIVSYTDFVHIRNMSRLISMRKQGVLLIINMCRFACCSTHQSKVSFNSAELYITSILRKKEFRNRKHISFIVFSSFE